MSMKKIKMSARRAAAVEAMLIRLSELPADLEVPEMNFDHDIMTFTEDEIDLDLDLDGDYAPISTSPARSTADPATIVSAPGSTKISIRVPNRILDLFKAQARKSCLGYQTLIVRSLKASAVAWAMGARMAA